MEECSGGIVIQWGSAVEVQSYNGGVQWRCSHTMGECNGCIVMQWRSAMEVMGECSRGVVIQWRSVMEEGLEMKWNLTRVNLFNFTCTSFPLHSYSARFPSIPPFHSSKQYKTKKCNEI